MADVNSTLRRLSDVDDLDIAPDEPDVRGWDVVDGQDRRIGEVKDLIVDPAAMKVRYLAVALDRRELHLDDDRRVLVPIERAQLDTDDDVVQLTGLDATAVAALPIDDGRWEHIGTARPIGKEARDTRARGATEAGDTRAAADTERQRLTRSAEELKIGKRQVRAGEVRVGKHVETEHVSQPVTRARERVVVERRPVSGDASANASISESGEIRVPVIEEEVVVEKRPVVKEELVIAKERITETEQVQADVRREEFDVEKTGDVDVRGDANVNRDRSRGGR